MTSLILLGPPGSGKGTYASRVGERLSIPAISTGEMFRQAIKSGTALGNEVKFYVEGGGLVPDPVLKRVLEERLSRQDCSRGFILDGYPRTLVQADDLDSILARNAGRPVLVVAIEASEELLVTRLGGRRSCPSCGAVFNVNSLKPKKEGVCDNCQAALVLRPDDEPATIRKRLALYEKQSAPLIARYRQKGNLETVNAGMPLDQAVARITGLLMQAGKV